MENKSICIIPARSGSKGLPNKNIKKIGGHSLLSFPIRAAIASKQFEKVLVSTDSKEYSEIGKKYGADIPFIRPQELSTDAANSIDVILHALNYLKDENNEEYDIVCLLEPTSPFTSAKDIEDSFRELSNNSKARSLVGVGICESQHPTYLNLLNKDKFLIPFFKEDKNRHIRRQDIQEQLFFFDGSIYLSYVEELYSKKSFYHENTIGKIFPKLKNTEIDDYEDLLIARAYFKYMQNKKVI